MKVQAIANARATIFEGQNLITKARLVTDAGVRLSHDGGAAPSTNVTAVSYEVFDLDSDTPTTVVNGTTTLTDTVVFTSDATGYLTTGWDKDGTGYNFAHVALNSDINWLGGHRYRVDYRVSSAATISPGTQAEGELVFSVEVRVLEGY